MKLVEWLVTMWVEWRVVWTVELKAVGMDVMMVVLSDALLVVKLVYWWVEKKVEKLAYHTVVLKAGKKVG